MFLENHGSGAFAATALLASLVSFLPSSVSAGERAEPLASVEVAPGLASFQPLIAYRLVQLTVTGPDGFEVVKSFGAGETPAVSLPGRDGLYKYELRFAPVLERKRGDRLDKGGASGGGGNSAVADRLTVQRGWFSLAQGSVVPGDLTERASGSGRKVVSLSALEPRQELTLSNSDGVIRNSLCVGFDCPDAPVYDDSTILLMENNTRIKFGDTSNAPFPNNDWEIEANSSFSGGAGYLGFNDCGSSDNDGGCATDLVFAVEAGARASALFVDRDGDVGIGTSTPVLDIHIVTGNTPSLRLDQDGSSGFTPQVWDIAGNETNFFVRDVTAGSRLPLRIQPGALSNAVFVQASGNVGLGTSAPNRSLHVRRTDATAQLLVEEASATAAERTLASFTNNGPVRLTLQNTADATGTWQIINRAAGLTFNLGGTGQAQAQLLDNGNLEVFGTVMGSVATPSSRDYKSSFDGRDNQEILAKVLGMPLTTWTYKPDRSSDQSLHFGPVAEDFHQAFGFGSESSIAMADVTGVAIASIQALNAKIDEVSALSGKIDQMSAERSELLEIVRRLEFQILALEAR